MRCACARVISIARSIRISRVRLKPNSTSAVDHAEQAEDHRQCKQHAEDLVDPVGARRDAGRLIGNLGIPGTASSVPSYRWRRYRRSHSKIEGLRGPLERDREVCGRCQRNISSSSVDRLSDDLVRRLLDLDYESSQSVSKVPRFVGPDAAEASSGHCQPHRGS